MRIFARNAPQKLLEMLEMHAASQTDLTCYHIALSQSSGGDSEIVGVILPLLEDLAEGDETSVYICDSADTFMLAPKPEDAHNTAFADAVETALRNAQLWPLVKVFTLPDDMVDVVTICQEAEAGGSAARNDAAPTRQRDLIAADALSTLSPLLKASLGQRRYERPQPLAMIADDDAITRMVAGNILSDRFLLAYAQDGESALTSYIAHAPDVLFLDIDMPWLDGYDVLSAIFDIDPDAYVVMLSGLKSRDNVARALREGAQAFVGKPFSRSLITLHAKQSPLVRQKLDQRTLAGPETPNVVAFSPSF